MNPFLVPHAQPWSRFICFLPFKAGMVQQFISLALGESCCRSELEEPGLHVILMAGWWEMLGAAPVWDVVSGGRRGKSWCGTAPSWGSQGLELPWSPVDIPCLGVWRSAGWLLSLWLLWRVKVDWNREVVWHATKAAVLDYRADWELGIKLPCWYILPFFSDHYKEMKVSLFRLLRPGRS